MEQSTLEITMISAKDLNKVNLMSKMDVYVAVSIAGDNSNQQIKTPVDKACGRNPTWNFTVKFSINEASLQQNRLSLVLKLKSERVLGDKDIGEVHVPIKELLDSNGSPDTKQFVSYQVRKPDGKTKGMISFSYQFIRQFQCTKVDEPVTAYPPPNVVATSCYPPAPPPRNEGVFYPPQPQSAAPPSQYAGYAHPPQQQAYGGYPPQQPGGGYVYPPPHQGYGYPPQQGYGYPPVVESPKRKNNLGMGLGVGLVGGALGGILLDEIVSDAAHNDYDAGYDAGVDTAGNDGGFDDGYDGGYDDGGGGYDGGFDNGCDGGFDDGGYDGGFDDGGFGF